jgi:hypothetical protein
MKGPIIKGASPLIHSKQAQLPSSTTKSHEINKYI